jgi:hypothetical protein
LQVVGARFAGKTVFLHELSRRLVSVGAPYTAVLIWDLGHQTPSTDELFMQQLARELSAALALKHPELVGELKSPRGNPYQDIRDVLDILAEDGGKVLAILDGFDRALSNGHLTRALWDQMRDLAMRPSFRLVTASRRTLRELIRNPEAQTSDFWNIFDPSPVRIGCFDDADVEAVLGTAARLELDAGARTELANASNGYPVLMLEVLNTLGAQEGTVKVNAENMRHACEQTMPVLNDKLDSLWSDCSPSGQDLMRRVRDEPSVQRAGIAVTDIEALTERGFIQQSGNSLHRPSRLLCRFLDQQGTEASSLVRLFGTPDGFNLNFKGVLERRIAQIDGLDATLKQFLERAVKDLPDYPIVFLSNVRGIVDQAFDLIWRAELEESRRIPSGWMAIWKRNGEKRVDEWETTFPQGVHRLRLLNLMTGTGASQRCAKFVTKSTHVLMNGAHAFGDFGQHREGAPIDPGTAYAALHLCIELAASLTRELSSAG